MSYTSLSIRTTLLISLTCHYY